MFGQADEIGVEGSAGLIGVSGKSLSYDFHQFASGIGVLGSSDRNRAGVFTGGGLLDSADIQETLHSSERDPHKHPAQLRLVPYHDNPSPLLPDYGLAGDFFAVRGQTDSDLPVSLWFCIKSYRGANPAEWVPISMGTTRKGGESALP